MFNVLPQPAQEKVIREYKQRRIIVTLGAVVFIQVAFLALLFPSWLASSSREKAAAAQIAMVDDSASQNSVAISRTVTATNGILSLVHTVALRPAVVPALDTILKYKTANIRILDLQYAATGTSTASVSVHGIAATRESLVSFVKALQTSESVDHVDLPVSNLAKDKNIDFSATVSIITVQ